MNNSEQISISENIPTSDNTEQIITPENVTISDNTEQIITLDNVTTSDNTGQIPISDYTITSSYVVNSIVIAITNIVLYTSADIQVACYDQYGNYKTNLYFKIVGDEYNAWGDNDDYIVAWVKTQMGVV
jgi:hypothetical protein